MYFNAASSPINSRSSALGVPVIAIILST